jgi:hypothetical protein
MAARSPGYKAQGSRVGRPHGGDQARERALRTAARVAEVPARTPAERLRALDTKLGVGVGAKRERAALEAQAEKIARVVAGSTAVAPAKVGSKAS